MWTYVTRNELSMCNYDRCLWSDCSPQLLIIIIVIVIVIDWENWFVAESGVMKVLSAHWAYKLWYCKTFLKKHSLVQLSRNFLLMEMWVAFYRGKVSCQWQNNTTLLSPYFFMHHCIRVSKPRHFHWDLDLYRVYTCMHTGCSKTEESLHKVDLENESLAEPTFQTQVDRDQWVIKLESYPLSYRPAPCRVTSQWLA